MQNIFFYIKLERQKLPKRQINLILESQLLTYKVHHTSFIYLASFVISYIQIVIANIFVCNADSVTSAVLEKLHGVPKQ